MEFCEKLTLFPKNVKSFKRSPYFYGLQRSLAMIWRNKALLPVGQNGLRGPRYFGCVFGKLQNNFRLVANS